MFSIFWEEDWCVGVPSHHDEVWKMSLQEIPLWVWKYQAVTFISLIPTLFHISYFLGKSSQGFLFPRKTKHGFWKSGSGGLRAERTDVSLVCGPAASRKWSSCWKGKHALIQLCPQKHDVGPNGCLLDVTGWHCFSFFVLNTSFSFHPGSGEGLIFETLRHAEFQPSLLRHSLCWIKTYVTGRRARCLVNRTSLVLFSAMCPRTCLVQIQF